MAFQTRVLRDGEWVTETVNLQAALRASAAPQLAAEPLPQPPVCGILSQTIVESPVVRWVLPVRLRSSTHNDIAFIGVSLPPYHDMRFYGTRVMQYQVSSWDVRLPS